MPSALVTSLMSAMAAVLLRLSQVFAERPGAGVERLLRPAEAAEDR